MDWIQQPNRWSCNACAWAMVLGLRLAELLAEVGHDGSTVYDERLPEPLKRVGFFDDEMSRVAVRRGYVCTPMIAESYVRQIHGESARVGRFWTPEEIRQLLPGRSGVLAIETDRGLHAVAWDGQWVYDPCLGIKPLSDYLNLKCFIWVARVQLSEDLKRALSAPLVIA